MRKYLCLCILLVGLYGCSAADNCNRAQNPDPTLHVLFIGNSYTYVNDLPAMFSQLACSGGHKVEAGMAATGGWRLTDHAASADTLAKLKQQKWDLVILQEQSEFPAIQYNRVQFVYPAVRQMAGQIKAAGAEPMLFLTWGHRAGLPAAGQTTYPAMQEQLNIGYYTIARELNLKVVPVGIAWARARAQAQPLDLWQEDGSHPNEQGSYLAACVFYAAIFQQSPEGLGYRAGLSLESAQVIQTLAAGTLQP